MRQRRRCYCTYVPHPKVLHDKVATADGGGYTHRRNIKACIVRCGRRNCIRGNGNNPRKLHAAVRRTIVIRFVLGMVLELLEIALQASLASCRRVPIASHRVEPIFAVVRQRTFDDLGIVFGEQSATKQPLS